MAEGTLVILRTDDKATAVASVIISDFLKCLGAECLIGLVLQDLTTFITWGEKIHMFGQKDRSQIL